MTKTNDKEMGVKSTVSAKCVAFWVVFIVINGELVL